MHRASSLQHIDATHMHVSNTEHAKPVVPTRSTPERLRAQNRTQTDESTGQCTIRQNPTQANTVYPCNHTQPHVSSVMVSAIVMDHL